MNREDKEWTDASQKWLDIHRQLEVLQAEEKALREVLIQIADSQNVTGGGIRLIRSLRKGNIQYAQIPELQNVDLEKYRKEPVEIWRLLPSDKNTY